MVRTKRVGPWAASLAMCFAAVMQAVPAHGQNTPQGTTPPGATPSGTQGPMVIERLQSGWAITPDVKVTRFEGGTHTLAGAYGGWVFDNQLLIGAGADWLIDPQHHTRELSYGGGVVQWRRGTDHWFGFSVQGLVGGGSATASGNVSVVQFSRNADRRLTPVLTTERLPFREDFFVAEPSADVLVRLSSHVRLHAGGGYRVVAGAHDLNEAIRGATGTVAVEVGPSSRR